MKKLRHFIYMLALSVVVTSCDSDIVSNTVSLQFVSATPTSIVLMGTGGAGLSEVSTLVFRVLDTDGTPLEGQAVDFALTTSVGGLSLSVTSDISDVNGDVETTVQSGNVITSVKVIATIQGTTTSSQSDQLAVATGLPDQDSTTLSITVPNPESFNFDNVVTGLLIQLGDIFNNPVPEGTTVSFTTEGGNIDGTCQVDITSLCVANWRSSAPRPVDGRVTILATALGQESFTDQNGNGVFDLGEPFTDLGEAFRDDNENGIHDPGEFFEDLNVNFVRDTGDGAYNGSACASGCSTQPTVHVRDSLVAIMATSAVIVTGLPAAIDVSGGNVTLTVTISDLNGNAPAANSSIAMAIDNGAFVNDPPSAIPDFIVNPYTFQVTLTTDGTPSVGNLTMTVTSPAGIISPAVPIIIPITD